MDLLTVHNHLVSLLLVYRDMIDKVSISTYTTGVVVSAWMNDKNLTSGYSWINFWEYDDEVFLNTKFETVMKYLKKEISSFPSNHQ